MKCRYERGALADLDERVGRIGAEGVIRRSGSPPM
jgi:hypothetical protein